jgi:hypothetical protein
MNYATAPASAGVFAVHVLLEFYPDFLQHFIHFTVLLVVLFPGYFGFILIITSKCINFIVLKTSCWQTVNQFALHDTISLTCKS